MEIEAPVADPMNNKCKNVDGSLLYSSRPGRKPVSCQQPIGAPRV